MEVKYEHLSNVTPIFLTVNFVLLLKVLLVVFFVFLVVVVSNLFNIYG